MQAVRTLILEVSKTLRCFSGEHGHATQVLSTLDQMDLSSRKQHQWAANKPPHARFLQQAINSMPPNLNALAGAMTAAMPQLQWRVDQGIYYESDADVGDGYRKGNMHCELIGPNGSAFLHDDFTLGLFFLTPHVLYRDHAHRAPELYLTLMGPTGWRFQDAQWRDMPAGTIIWNAPETSHATRIYEQPFLSVYSWIRDVHSKCRVVQRDDWTEIEQALEASPLFFDRRARS